ncbi:outer membrane beta-barrel family protein [Pedobacter kyonggii]|uniref:TonB-dependent receptor n=1 Tax=Pedobacter kyonggii TaxID=1926871 RepID=A0A4Q9HGF3_9SPHI|nr:outer membrane beta-barrel family protein [Pedobacter kyonggii]TBO44287.1 TonB-dependent receptor [Pedobacter kyonggii]
MKIKFALTIIFISSHIFSFAQEKSNNHIIKGRIRDSITNAPISYVTVTLNSIKGLPVRSTLSKTDGSFLLEKVSAEATSVAINAVGYTAKTIYIDSIKIKSENIDLGNILLNSRTNELKEINVSAQKPIIKQETDRIIYDVQADPDSKGQNALDIMRKVPLISLDADDKIQLKGSSKYLILINGRSSGILTRNPREILLSMPALHMQKIEVITTPPAKYDSEGVSGIINIITTQNKNDGYNALIGTFFNSLIGEGFWSELTLKRKKFGISGFMMGLLNNPPHTEINNYRIQNDPFGSKVLQEGANRSDGNHKDGNIEISYDIDSLNLVTGSFALNFEKGDQTENDLFRIFNKNNDIDKLYRLNYNNRSHINGYDIGVNYQRGFKNNKNRLFTTSYKLITFDNDQNITNAATEKFNYYNDDLWQQNGSGSQEQTFQLDYVHPLKNLDIEGGIKFISRKNYSEFLTGNFDTPEIKIPTESDKFDYLQNIYSAYNSYYLKLKNWGIKLGFRLERTTINANSLSLSTAINNNYSNFIPSLSVQRNLNNARSLNFGYSQRLQRPGIAQLNPFVNKSNPLFYYSGNPNLLPVVNHNFEFGYSQSTKGYFMISADYSFAHNTIQNLISLGLDSISRSTYYNIGKSENTGLNISYSYPITKKLNLNINGRASYTWLQGYINNELQKNSGIQANSNASLSYKLEHDWRLSFNFGYTSRSVLLQGSLNEYYNSSIIVNKEFLKKKAGIFMNLKNPLQKFRHATTLSNTDFFTQQSDIKSYYRGIYINFYYRFGGLDEKIKKNKRGVNNDDIK